MHQSKLGSFLEAVVNTALGLVIAMGATALIAYCYDIPITARNNFILTAWMTVISVIRSYLLRRLFNRWHKVQAYLSLWWILHRPGIVDAIDRICDAYSKYGAGRPGRF